MKVNKGFTDYSGSIKDRVVAIYKDIYTNTNQTCQWMIDFISACYYNNELDFKSLNLDPVDSSIFINVMTGFFSKWLPKVSEYLARTSILNNPLGDSKIAAIKKSPVDLASGDILNVKDLDTFMGQEELNIDSTKILSQSRFNNKVCEEFRLDFKKYIVLLGGIND